MLHGLARWTFFNQSRMKPSRKKKQRMKIKELQLNGPEKRVQELWEFVIAQAIEEILIRTGIVPKSLVLPEHGGHMDSRAGILIKSE